MIRINRRIAILTAKYLVDPCLAFVLTQGRLRYPDYVPKLAALASHGDAIQMATSVGDVRALKRLYSAAHWGKFCGINADAAARGHLNVVKWAWSKRITWNTWVCHNAAAGGHLRVIRWARKHGCAWDSYTSVCAAREGHLAVLKWLWANGCPWSGDAFREADRNGHADVLRWFLEHET